MKWILLPLIAAAVLSAETKQERGRKMVDEALAALGGNAFLEMKDRVESGRAYSFYRERLTGLAVATIYTRYLSGPAGEEKLAVRERQAFGKNEDQVVLFTDTGGYTLTYRGARPIKPDRYQRYADTTRRNFLYILRERLNEPGMIYEYRETTVWQNIPVEIVDITDADNNGVAVYFHRTTKLPVRQVFYRRDPLTKERNEEVTIYSKYRDVGGGVQWPFNILSERNGEKVFELFSESVAINKGLTDNLFMLPGDLKVLPPER
jgi:hypothetical protein